MVKIDENFQSAFDGRVALAALDVGDEANAARVMFIARVVQTLCRRKSHVKPLFPEYANFDSR